MRLIYSIFLALFLFVMNGCSTNNIDYALARAAGNKPADFFRFTAPDKVDKWYFETEDYTALPPHTYQKDWNGMSGWIGAYIYGGIAFGVANADQSKVGKYIGYGIGISSYTGKYGERQRVIESKDIGYYKQLFPVKTLKNGTTANVNVHFETHGKENYNCSVSESYDKSRGVHSKGYTCYKFNPSHAKYKDVGIELIYTNSPHLPAKYKHLAKQYTYQDLQNRAKRTLDSLYIKDGW